MEDAASADRSNEGERHGQNGGEGGRRLACRSCRLSRPFVLPPQTPAGASATAMDEASGHRVRQSGDRLHGSAPQVLRAEAAGGLLASEAYSRWPPAAEPLAPGRPKISEFLVERVEESQRGGQFLLVESLPRLGGRFCQRVEVLTGDGPCALHVVHVHYTAVRTLPRPANVPRFLEAVETRRDRARGQPQLFPQPAGCQRFRAVEDYAERLHVGGVQAMGGCETVDQSADLPVRTTQGDGEPLEVAGHPRGG